MNYTAAIQYLYDLQMFGMKLGLENTFKLAALAGNPQDKLRFIHVAGTNGKGSTCAMLESMLRHAGYRTALYTSPHLLRFNERVRIDGVEVDDLSLGTAFEAVETARTTGAAIALTYFEFSTLAVKNRIHSELLRMARDYASERRAASRPVPADVALILGELS